MSDRIDHRVLYPRGAPNPPRGTPNPRGAPNLPSQTHAARLPARRAVSALYLGSGLLSSPAAILNPFARQIVVIKQLFAAMLGERAEIG